MSGDLQLRVEVLAWLRQQKSRETFTRSAIARQIDIAPDRRNRLRRVLGELESAGQIEQPRRARYRAKFDERAEEVERLAKSSKKPLIAAELLAVGVIRFDKSRSAVLVPDGSRGRNRGKYGRQTDELAFLPPDKTGTALDGDLVEVKLQKLPQTQRRRPGRPVRHRDELREKPIGRVIKVLERRCREIVGTYREKGGKKFLYVEPDSRLLPKSIDLDLNLAPLPDPPPDPDDKVVVEIIAWESRFAIPRGRIIEVLGPPDAPGVDIMSILAKHQLPRHFPPQILREAEEYPSDVAPGDLRDREDWRNEPVFTVDPSDAKDFDDAILVKKLPSGGFELAVHIADVSHYVKPGTGIDEEALKRGNSTYLADRVIPMLPEVLSNGLCSLKPGVDRLTRCAIMEFDENGRPGKVRFGKAVIRSARRFTYEDAYAWMKVGKNASDADPAWRERLNTAWELAACLRQRRFEAGAFDMDFPEVRVVVDRETGVATKLEKIEYDESHQMIEEFMLAANEAVARHIREKQKACIYRVHEDPDPAKFFEFREFVLGFGIQMGDPEQRTEVQRVLKKIRGTKEEHAIKIALLRSMKRADYRSSPDGHYGLAKSNYTHFTSPIRRYADLVVHRVLDSILSGGKNLIGYTENGLTEVATHISKTERISADAEMESQRLKQYEFLAHLSRGPVQKRPVFRAVVMDLRHIGVFVELIEYQIKGLVRADDLPSTAKKPDYRFDASNRCFVDRSARRAIHISDEIDVVVKEVDFDKMRIDFLGVGDAPKI